MTLVSRLATDCVSMSSSALSFWRGSPFCKWVIATKWIIPPEMPPPLVQWDPKEKEKQLTVDVLLELVELLWAERGPLLAVGHGAVLAPLYAYEGRGESRRSG